MTYSSGSTVFDTDVVNQFWNTYLSGNISAGSAYVNGSTSGGTTNFSNANTVQVQYPQTFKGAKQGQESSKSTYKKVPSK